MPAVIRPLFHASVEPASDFPPTIAQYREKLASGGDLIRHGRKCPAAPDISIITPVFNAESLIMRALQAVERQSSGNIEHIFVDGGSTDRTLALLQDNMDKVGILVSGKDAGTSDAINKGIALARGKYISWLPVDDTAAPDFLEMAFSALERSGASFVYGRSAMRYPTGQQRFYVPPEDYVRQALRGRTAIDARTMVMRRAMFEELGLLRLNLRFGNDLEWLIRIVKAGHVGYYDERLFVLADWGGLTAKAPIRAALEAGTIALRAGGPRIGIAMEIGRAIAGILVRKGLGQFDPRLKYVSWKRLNGGSVL